VNKAVIIFSVAIVALIAIYSFSTIDKYPDNVPEENVTMYKSEYLKTINSHDLNMQLEQNFLPLFDKVTSVDAQFSQEIGYYYIVFGVKNNTKKIELLKIEKVDVENETYTYFDFEGFTVTENTVYCWRGFFLCLPCQLQSEAACIIICGPWPIACD
jgi:hypothetical protein